MKDFFISYNKKDRDWARWIAWHVEALGFEVVFQDRDFQAGNNFVLQMQHALENTRKVLVVLSPHYLEGQYAHPEWAAAFNNDPRGMNLRLGVAFSTGGYFRDQ